MAVATMDSPRHTPELRSAGPRTAMLYFAGFRFDPVESCLWKGDDEVSLRPKTAGVLRCLLLHGGDVTSRRTLLADVWPDGFVSDAVLNVCVNELRKVFADDPSHPRFIATVPRRGYRFVAAVSTNPIALDEAVQRVFVGREREVEMLRSWWQLALGGERQLVFVAAPAGVGKTTLTDVFSRHVAGDGGAVIGFGQCAEQFGEAESYLPVLDALRGLARGPDGRRILGVLRSIAPTWLMQLPGLLDLDELTVPAASSTRMLREMANALSETRRSPAAAAGARGPPPQ